jgi:hypothetical protein
MEICVGVGVGVGVGVDCGPEAQAASNTINEVMPPMLK